MICVVASRSKITVCNKPPAFLEQGLPAWGICWLKWSPAFPFTARGGKLGSSRSAGCQLPGPSCSSSKWAYGALGILWWPLQDLFQAWLNKPLLSWQLRQIFLRKGHVIVSFSSSSTFFFSKLSAYADLMATVVSAENLTPDSCVDRENIHICANAEHL